MTTAAEEVSTAPCTAAWQRAQRIGLGIDVPQGATDEHLTEPRDSAPIRSTLTTTLKLMY